MQLDVWESAQGGQTRLDFGLQFALRLNEKSYGQRQAQFHHVWNAHGASFPPGAGKKRYDHRSGGRGAGIRGDLPPPPMRRQRRWQDVRPYAEQLMELIGNFGGANGESEILLYRLRAIGPYRAVTAS